MCYDTVRNKKQILFNLVVADAMDGPALVIFGNERSFRESATAKDGTRVILHRLRWVFLNVAFFFFIYWQMFFCH